MNCSWCLQCFLITVFLTLNLLSVVRTVPPEYCLSPLNRSDCNAPPRAVYSYYKPGSRCELETWRGCPTLNKFENEYLCTINCIFRIKQVAEVSRHPCDIPLDQEKCEKTSILVYTHIDGSCEEVVWRGCPSPNKFNTEADCEAACQVNTMDDKLLNLDEKGLLSINQILEDIIEEEMTTTEATASITVVGTVVTVPTTVTEAVVGTVTTVPTTVAETEVTESDVVSEEDEDVTESKIEAGTEPTTVPSVESEDVPAVRPTVISDYNY